MPLFRFLVCVTAKNPSPRAGARGPAAASILKQGRRDLNSQPLDLESSALPIELHPYARVWLEKKRHKRNRAADARPRRKRRPATLASPRAVADHLFTYLMTFVTTPEPTVRPPSRIAKRTFSSIVIGLIRLICKRTLSPGMHISASPIKSALPVTSVVRK